MTKLFMNIITVNPQNVSMLVILVAACVWLAVWLVLLIDIFNQPRSIVWKGVWMLFSTIPVAGGILYSLSELLTSDWRKAFHWRAHDTKSTKKTSKA